MKPAVSCLGGERSSPVDDVVMLGYLCFMLPAQEGALSTMYVPFGIASYMDPMTATAVLKAALLRSVLRNYYCIL